MNKQKLITLINKEIDQEITVDEKMILQKEINSNQESKQLYNELKETSVLLHNENIEEYELNIADEVLNQIDHQKYSRKSDKTFSLYDLFTRKNLALSYSLGIVSGIVLVSILYLTGILYTPDEGITGTMGSADNYSNFQKADEILINSEGIKGSITSQFQADMVIANIQLNSTEKYRIDFSYNENNVYVYSIKPLQLNEESNFISGKNFININNKGENKFLILFKNNVQGESIKIALSSDIGPGSEYTLQTH